jgi:hypothetical protein
MRAIALVALLLVGCTAGPGGTPGPASPEASVAPASPTASAPTAVPTNPASASPVPATTFTADDEAIAGLIRAGADEAIPQLKLLNSMDPGKLEDLFLPLGTWIDAQRAGVEAYTASSCTADAAALFVEGMDAYEDIKETFMSWRDWGANGHPFSRGAPGLVVELFEEALVELEASCPT